jgi:hypothetical protein
MPARSEDDLSAVLRTLSGAGQMQGALCFLIGAMVRGPAPAEIAFLAMRLQAELRRQSASQWQLKETSTRRTAPNPPKAG